MMQTAALWRVIPSTQDRFLNEKAGGANAAGREFHMAQTVILTGNSQRAVAKQLIERAPVNAVVTIREETRSGEQNAKMWAMLSDISRAKPEGRHWTPETWKAAFMHVLGHQVQFCEGLDNSGPFPLGFRSSRLTVRQMADLITVIDEYGSRHGVAWSDPESRKAAA